MTTKELIPLETFLHNVFPAGDYPNEGESLAKERLFKPRRRARGVCIESPIAWESDFSGDRNAQMQLQGWTMFHPIMNVFDVLSDKESAVRYLLDVVSDWWDRYRTDPDDIMTTRTPESYAWYDMSVGFRALILAFFLNRIEYYDVLIANRETELLRSVAMKHIRHLRNPAVFYPNNHGIFQMHGLRGLAETCDYEAAEEDKRYAEETMVSLLRSQFDSNGVHVEHSPHYHIFVLKTFSDVAVSGWYAGKEQFASTLDAAKATVPWLVDPLRRPAAVGDSIPTVQKDIQFPTLSGKEPLLRSDFDTSGYAIARSGWDVPTEKATYLFFTASYNSKSHKHRDCLSFEWFEAGHKRLTDSGKYGYYGDERRRYVLSVRAHNTVEIEGLDILRMSPYGSAIRGSGIESGGIYKASGELAFRSVLHKRDLYLDPGRWLVVDDHLAFNRPREATQWFHVALGHDLVRITPTSAVFLGPDGRHLAMQTLNQNAEMLVHYGDAEVWQGFVSENDDHIAPGYAVGYRIRADQDRIVTAIALGEGELDDALIYGAGDLSGGELPQRSTPMNTSNNTRRVRGLDALQIESGSHLYLVATHRGKTGVQVLHDGRDALVVLLDDAPVFGSNDEERLDWLHIDGTTTAAIFDPTLVAYPDLQRGWFLGQESKDGIELTRDLVTYLRRQLGIPEQRTVLVGRGPAGFSALKLGEWLLRCPVVAQDPEYPDSESSHLATVAEAVYANWSSKQASLILRDRLRLTSAFGERRARTVLIQSSPTNHAANPDPLIDSQRIECEPEAATDALHGAVASILLEET